MYFVFYKPLLIFKEVGSVKDKEKQHTKTDI